MYVEPDNTAELKNEIHSINISNVKVNKITKSLYIPYVHYANRLTHL